MSYRYIGLLMVLLILYLSRLDKKVICYIFTPHNPMVRFFGDDAIFNWTTSDGKKIYSAKFGIAKDNIPDPKFIDVNVYTNIVHFNKGLDPKYRNRVDFIGNLTAGRAWFILKSLTINDTDEYSAMIRGELGIFPYTVKLEVKEKELIPAHFTTGTTLRTKAGKRPVQPMITASPKEPKCYTDLVRAIEKEIPKIMFMAYGIMYENDEGDKVVLNDNDLCLRVAMFSKKKVPGTQVHRLKTRLKLKIFEALFTERITRTEQSTEISMTSESQKGYHSTLFILLLTFGVLVSVALIIIITCVIKDKWGDRLSTCTFQPLSKGLVPHNEEIV